MNKILILFFLCTLFSACNENNSANKNKKPTLKEMAQGTVHYPENLKAVFDAHGGSTRWKNMKTLYFEQGSGDNLEKHTIDLTTRKSRTETKNYTLGYDGDMTWLVQDSIYMKPERAPYMHNLMFYFLAMPFVLGDEGINYSVADSLKTDEATFPGIRISYNNDVGLSDKDEYILYSNLKSHKMTWLAYTATFDTDQRSADFRFIKYANWKEFNGLMLPTLLQWYEVKDGKPTSSLRSEQLFNNIVISKQEADPGIFEKPENGTFTSAQ